MSMKKLLLMLLYVVFMVGCVTIDWAYCATDWDYYLNPNSLGYTESALPAICELCGKTFTYSAHQLETYKDGNIQCPYCGHTQSLKEAALRGANAVEQQEKEEWGHVLTEGIIGGLQNYNYSQQRKYQQQQQLTSEFLANFGTRRNKHSRSNQIDCWEDLRGHTVCNDGTDCYTDVRGHLICN